MRLVVVGGQSRNLGKTALVCDIVRAFADLTWTAIKITQCKEGECPVEGENCRCRPEEHRSAICEEQDRNGRGDSSRFLAAGAARSLWVRVKQGQLGEALPALRREMADAAYVIVESNSLLEFVEPDLYLALLDSGTSDFKASARQFLDRAHAMVLREPGTAPPAWTASVAGTLGDKPTFVLPAGCSSTPELLELVRAHLFAVRSG